MKVFISYSHTDVDTLTEIVSQVEVALPDVNIWYAQDEDTAWETIQRHIRQADLFLLLLSEAWLASQAKRKEYSLAKALGKSIIPARTSQAVRVPRALAALNVIDLTKARGMDHLLASLGVVPGAPQGTAFASEQVGSAGVTPKAQPPTTPLPFDDLNAAKRPSAAQVRDDLLAPGVTISPAPEAPAAPKPIAVPAGEPVPADATQRLPLFSVITLVTFAAVIVGIVLISLDVLDWGLLILLGGVILGAILSLVVFIQRRT